MSLNTIAKIWTTLFTKPLASKQQHSMFDLLNSLDICGH